MSDETNKTDWNRVERMARPDEAPSSDGALVPSRPQDVAIPSPANIGEPTGILAKYKANKLERKAALKALEKSYSGQLSVLEHQIVKAEGLRKTEISVLAEEFLKDLDARHLEVLAEIGMRNKGTREAALVNLTEQTVEKLKDVQQRDWPESLVRDTVRDLLELRERLVREIMEELGNAEMES